MAFIYTDIEDDIVARLTSLLPAGYNVIAMPEKENQYNIGKDKVLILIAFADSSFADTTAMDIITQMESVSVMCNIKSSRLRGTFSINEALQLLKVALIGFRPRNLSKLSATKIEFDDRSVADNYFSYNFNLSGKKLNVEVQEEEILPLLKKITFESDQASSFDNVSFDQADFQTPTLFEVPQVNI